MAYADKLPGAQNRQQGILAVLGAWAQQDNAGAGAWVKQLPAGPLHDQSVEALASALAPKDPQAALAR